MSQKTDDSKKIRLYGHKMINFKVIREPFNKYKLGDGVYLVSKFVLIMVHFEKDIEKILKNNENLNNIQTGVNLKNQVLLGIDGPDDMKGIPNNIEGTNLREHIINDDVEILESQESFFEYELENGFIIKGKTVVINVSKTDLFNSEGMPIYLVDHSVQFKISLPQKLQEKFKKKGVIKK
jgi:hypothetical protein